jgi:hypothetical protein
VVKLLAGALVLCAGALAAFGGSEPPGATQDGQLPDLSQELPSDLSVARAPEGARPGFRLGFDSAVSNVGTGPLIIVAERPDPGHAQMVAAQLVHRPGAAPRRIPDRGELRYVRSRDHRHWHLLGFERYELRSAGSGGVVARDRKTGFCLGDRYRLARPLPGRPENAEYPGRCGLDRPDLLRLTQAISVGWGDDYPSHLEGQWLALDGLSSDEYVLVHRVNVERRLAEETHGNNAASVRLSLRWSDGVPRVRVVARCPGTTRCAA